MVATGLDLPWSLVRVAARSTLVSERDTARVKEISDSGVVRTVGTIPGVVPGGEGGLLGLAVLALGDPGAQGGLPGGTSTPFLYAYTTTATDNRVIRMPLTGAPGSYGIDTAARQVIIRGIPKAGNHNGGRIKFGPDGALYITAGDAGQRERAQEMGYLGGKILRVNPDGTIPADNPVADSPVYTLGHRNPQGIAWDDTGQLWAAEFGQDTWDEFNRIDKGVNYGWPIVEGHSDDGRFRNPVHQWSTDEASPSGLLYTRGTFFLAALRGERLWRIVPSAGATTATTSATLTGEFGRLRDVIEGPDDTIWVITNNTGRSPRPGDDRVLQLHLAR
ncbi:PQQ-dependent sugar dehydrogenase [Glaciihabitans sp. dw_435]|uniref:PQQ-dependent sugar dehydrogenase n=1 Tax=Glaciihabitans sp. dw_435 TaxID=2720081 RepID=UPI0027DD1CBA|nr:PQQ-dependent sugar dehydrogenase [Glaciihabitans sp. dw_435]